MSIEIKTEVEVSYPVILDGRELGRFSKAKLWELYHAIGATLTQADRCTDWQEIIHEVCKAYKLEQRELFSKGRLQRFAWPRQVAMCLIYEHTDMSLNEVGQIFGGRDHGTVLHARNKVNGRKNTKIEGPVIAAIEKALEAKREPIMVNTTNCFSQHSTT